MSQTKKKSGSAAFLVLLTLVLTAGIAYGAYRYINSGAPVTASAAATAAIPEDAPKEIMTSEDIINLPTSATLVDGKYYCGDDTLMGVVNMVIPEISSEAQPYYFYEGICDPTKTGIVINYNADYIFIRNGVWDYSFIGVAKFDLDSYSYMVKYGVALLDRTGTLNFNGGTYNVVNGLVIGYPTSEPIAGMLDFAYSS